jgi:pimeloyl-ACP methyl ester carboxylesterase
VDSTLDARTRVGTRTAKSASTLPRTVPTATNGGVELYYEVDGDGEPVAFLGDVGYGAWQWAWQAPAVAGPFEAVVHDGRGVGRSDAPPGPYAPADLLRDLRAVCAAAGAGRPHLVGAGLGGLLALATALDGPVNPRSLVLLGTAASGDDIDPEPLYGDPDDDAALAASLRAALSTGFVDEHPDEVDRMVAWRRAEDADRAAFDARAAVLPALDVADRLYEVTTPALVVHGTADAVCPLDDGRALAEGLPRGELRPVEGAGHLVGVEASRAVNDALVGFLESQTDGDENE